MFALYLCHDTHGTEYSIGKIVTDMLFLGYFPFAQSKPLHEDVYGFDYWLYAEPVD